MNIVKKNNALFMTPAMSFHIKRGIRLNQFGRVSGKLFTEINRIFCCLV